MPLAPGAPTLTAPTFYLTGRQSIRPAAFLLATLAALAALSAVLFALAHSHHAHLRPDNSDAGRSAGSTAGAPATDDDKDDDPNQVDTIYLGDPADAPVPAHRGDHVSPVHATIVVRLPRFGQEVGLIPDIPAGRLLYSWLAAFNQGNEAALRDLLPNTAATGSAAAQLELRHITGGFTLLSAKEVQPGVLVFRLRAQPPLSTEALGTLQLRPNASPAAIASFSLRAVPPPIPDTAPTAPQ